MFPLAFVAGWLQGHWWGFISRNYVVWPAFFRMNVFVALKGSHFWFYIPIRSTFSLTDRRQKLQTMSFTNWPQSVTTAEYRDLQRCCQILCGPTVRLLRISCSKAAIFPKLYRIQWNVLTYCKQRWYIVINLTNFCPQIFTKSVSHYRSDGQHNSEYLPPSRIFRPFTARSLSGCTFTEFWSTIDSIVCVCILLYMLFSVL